MRRLSFLLLLLLAACAFASPVARLAEEAEAVYSADGTAASTSSIGYLDVYVPSDDILQYVRVNVSSLSNTNLASKEAWQAVAASPNGARTRLFVNTTGKSANYNVSSAVVPSIELRLSYANALGGHELVPGANTLRFSLYVNSSSELATSILVQAGTTGTDPLNFSSPLASDSDSDGYKDRLVWSGTLSSTPTLIQFNATIANGTNFNTSLRYADLDDGYGILANHTQSSAFSGLTIANTFSRGPIRQGVDMELFDVWKARGFIRNTATGLNYTVHSWSLYAVDDMSQVASGTLEQTLVPNGMIYTPWYDTQSASKAYYASAFNWEINWAASQTSALLTSRANLPTLYLLDLWTQKSVTVESTNPKAHMVRVEDLVRNTGHSSANISSVTITSVVPHKTVGDARRQLAISDAVVYFNSGGNSTLLSVTPTVTQPTDSADGSVAATVTSSAIGRPLRQDEDVRLVYKLTATPAPVLHRFSLSGSAQVTTVSGTPYTQSFIASTLDIPEVSSGPQAGGAAAPVEVVSAPSTVAISIDVSKAESLIASGEAAQAAETLKTIISDQRLSISETKASSLLAGELEAIDITELGITPASLKEGRQLLDTAAAKLALAEKETDTQKRLELIKEALELQEQAQQQLPEIKTVSEDAEVQGIDALGADAALAVSTTSAAKTAIRDARDKTSLTSGSLELSRTAKVYSVTNAEKSTKTKFRTKVELVTKAARDVWGVRLIEVIPKSAANFSSEVVFSEQPEILQADPIVAWTLDSMRRDETRVFSYVLRGRVAQLMEQSISLASVEKTRIQEVEVAALGIEEEAFLTEAVRVGQPVFWSKTLKVSNPNTVPSVQSFSIIIPIDAVTVEVNEGEIKPKEVFDGGRRYVQWSEEVKPGEHAFRVRVSTPPVIESSRAVEVLNSTAEEATVATTILLENLARESYSDIEYDFPVEYDKVLSIDAGEPLRYRRNGGQITILLPGIGPRENATILLVSRETPPLLEIGINKAKSLDTSIVDLTTVVVASETTSSPHIELEVTGPAPAQDTVYVDLMPLSTLEAGGRVVLQNSIDLASLPAGDYAVSVLFRKDTHTIRSRQETVTIKGAQAHRPILQLFAFVLCIFLVVTGSKYLVSEHGDRLYGLLYGEKAQAKPHGILCSSCGKRLKLEDVYRCSSCGKILCGEHKQVYKNQEYCGDCFSRIKAQA